MLRLIHECTSSKGWLWPQARLTGVASPHQEHVFIIKVGQTDAPLGGEQWVSPMDVYIFLYLILVGAVY